MSRKSWFFNITFLCEICMYLIQFLDLQIAQISTRTYVECCRGRREDLGIKDRVQVTGWLKFRLGISCAELFGANSMVSSACHFSTR